MLSFLLRPLLLLAEKLTARWGQPVVVESSI